MIEGNELRKIINRKSRLRLEDSINPYEKIETRRELFSRMGIYDGLISLLLNQKETRPLLDDKGNIKIEIETYKKAEKIIPGLITQVYRIESMFPPEVAFFGGLYDNNGRINNKNLELINDLTGEKNFANVATIEFSHTNKIDGITKDLLGYVPKRILFIIGYGQGNIETNKRMIDKGYLSYVCSVISDHDFRLIDGVGSKLMQPIFNEIDNLDEKNTAKSYLTTWVDTGTNKNKVNLSHHPAVGFWFRQHYDPISIQEATELVDIVKEKHEINGITGRKYELRETTTEEINAKLYGNNFVRKLGLKGTEAYNFSENWKEPFAVMPNHYENGWTGIIMVRDPVKVRLKQKGKYCKNNLEKK